jgi:hypothetical protein
MNKRLSNQLIRESREAANKLMEKCEKLLAGSEKIAKRFVELQREIKKSK